VINYVLISRVNPPFQLRAMCFYMRSINISRRGLVPKLTS